MDTLVQNKVTHVITSPIVTGNGLLGIKEFGNPKNFDYRKPKTLCREPGPLASLQPSAMAAILKSEIEQRISSFGLWFGYATNNDIDQVLSFVQTRYPVELAHEISAYDLYRFMTFGHGLLVRHHDGRIAGCLFEVGYDTLDRTSYTLRLGVDPDLSGIGLGTDLITYSCLLAMERGSKVKRGLLDLNNFVSAAILLNKVGWVAEGFYPNIHPLGTCFTISLPLTPAGLCQNRIDRQAVSRFMHEGVEGRDYELADWQDVAKLTWLYSETDFRVVSILRDSNGGDRHVYLAVPGRPMFSDGASS